jgi:hypothetical protein
MNLGERIGLLALLLGIAGGCSSMDPEDDTYAAIYGLGAAGGGGGTGAQGGSAGDDSTGDIPPGFDCLDANPSSLMVEPVRTPTRVLYRVPIVDFDSLTPIPDLSVEACFTSDCVALPRCTSVTPAPTERCAIVTPPAMGALYTIDLPYNFEGGLKLTKEPDYAEMDYFFGGPLVGSPDVAVADGGNAVFGLPIPVLLKSSRQRAYNEVGAGPVDNTRGTLAVRTLSCERTMTALAPLTQGTRAAGVSLEALGNDPTDDGAFAWTLSSLNQFTPSRLVTDARGVAGFLNAPPVSMEVRAVLPDETTFGAATLRVRADVITLAELRPGLGLWGQ